MGKRGLRAASWLPLLLKTVRHDSRSRFVRPRHSVSQPVIHSLTHSFIHSLTHSFSQPVNEMSKRNAKMHRRQSVFMADLTEFEFGLAWLGSVRDGMELSPDRD